MEQINYNRRHKIVIDSQQTREISLMLSFVWKESLENEVWKEIEGFNSEYFISTHGRVLSLKEDGYKLMKPFICGTGYYQLDLCKEGKDDKRQIHRLVAEAFIDNPERKTIVHHKDGNKRNNKVSNLQWTTPAEHTAIHTAQQKERSKKEQTHENEELLS